MKLRIRTRRKGRLSIDSGGHVSTRNKLVFKLQKASDKANRDKKREAKEERQGEQRAARIHLYPPGTVLNKSGSLVGMAPNQMESAHRKLMGMRRFYNKKMPVPACNGCSFANQCPEFKAGYACAFLPMLNSHKVESIEDLREYMREMVAANMRRVHFALTGETITGAKPSLETTEMTALVFQQLKDLHGIEQEAGTEEIEVEGDASVIGQLFGDLRGLVDDTRVARAKRLNEEPPRLRLQDKRSKNRTPEEVSQDIEDEFGAIQPGVDVDLVQAYQTDQLLSRSRGKRRKSPSSAVIEVSTSKVSTSKV